MSDSIEQEARTMGWVPKEDFRGNESRWVDADVFVERGHTVLPIVKKKNQELQAQLAATQAEQKRLADLFAASQESIKALQEFHQQNTKEQVERARRSLLEELKRAKADGDIDREVELTDQLQQANASLAQKKQEPAPKDEVAYTEIDPQAAAWAERNTWYGREPRKTSLANSIANALRADPENDHIVGQVFFDLVDKELAARANGKQHDKVGGAQHSGDGGGGSPKRGYAALDPEAKRICDADAKKFVGEGKMYKTLAEWREYYAGAVLGE